jgi:hypothetical protein
MSTSWQNRKTKDPKARGRRVSRLGGDFQNDHSAAAQVPFYTLDPSTQHLEPLAQTAWKVEQVKNSYVCSNYSEKTSDTGCPGVGEILEIERSENERFEWISGDYLMRDIAEMIATGNWKGLQAIADTVGNHELSYEKTLPNQSAATVWTMVACDQLWEKGCNRDQVTKAAIRAEAERLWARAVCHRKKLMPTPENIESQKLPGVKGQRVWEALGLEDIKSAPPGRLKKSDPRLVPAGSQRIRTKN